MRRSGCVRGVVLLAVAYGLGLGGCADERSLAGGNAAETQNTLQATILDEKGIPAARAAVEIRPAGDLADSTGPTQGTVLRTIADERGVARFEGIAATEWRLVANVSGRSATQVVEVAGDRTSTATVARPSTLLGRVSLDKGIARAWVSLDGMGIGAFTDSAGSFRLEEVPPGLVHLTAVAQGAGRLASRTALLAQADTLDLGLLVADDPYLWSSRKDLWFDTRVTAANIPTDVDTIPILVRLEGSEFPVGARSDGADLRVVDTTRAPLAFEIAHWDSAARSARVWVLMPRVRGRDSTQRISLWWGNPVAAPRSRPGDVFRTADGWGRAMRFDGAPSGTWRDATGTLGDVAIPTGTTAMTSPVGAARKLRYRDTLAFSGAGIDLARGFTISAWIRLDSIGGVLLSRFPSLQDKSPAAKFLMFQRSASVRGLTPEYLSYKSPEESIRVWAKDSIALGAWEHVVLVGRPRAPDTLELEWFQGRYSILPGGEHAVVGPDGAADLFRTYGIAGDLASVWIQGVARRDDWILLAHESQREDSPLIRFGALAEP